MARRTYNQFCGLARGLDIVGERWTLLIVRELMARPKRYIDLSDALDGIGSSLLAARLRQLEEDAVVRHRKLPPPAAAVVYELTESGNELAEALIPLALWGMRRLFAPGPEDAYKAEWTLVVLARFIDASAVDAAYTYHFRLGDSSALLSIRNGKAEVTAGPLAPVDATLISDSATISDLSAGRLALDEAIATGRIALQGDAAALVVLRGILPQRIPERIRIVSD
ncbi:winged helix-turn-helix transcriptional regulator [Nocardia pseudovaccinii]|uniref:winged helix-turn-helix transcriptional regulator n=1 Tax=Nocardia pseudovaccinii TaxID=189540 RepID=UPI0007A4F278|nr:winged helix-turn-helix transcriptional regulator [Nocardia pseudovaccinii]